MVVAACIILSSLVLVMQVIGELNIKVQSNQHSFWLPFSHIFNVLSTSYFTPMYR